MIRSQPVRHEKIFCPPRELQICAHLPVSSSEHDEERRRRLHPARAPTLYIHIRPARLKTCSGLSHCRKLLPREVKCYPGYPVPQSCAIVLIAIGRHVFGRATNGLGPISSIVRDRGRALQVTSLQIRARQSTIFDKNGRACTTWLHIFLDRKSSAFI